MDRAVGRVSFGDLDVFHRAYGHVEEGKSLSGAAQEIVESRKAVDDAITRVEKALGVPVVKREKRGKRLAPTDQGREFCGQAGEFARSFERVVRQIGGRSDRVAVMGSEFAVNFLLPTVFKESGFLAEHANADVSVSEGRWNEMLDAVGRGDVDFALGPEPASKGDVSTDKLATVKRSFIFQSAYYTGRQRPGRFDLSLLEDETVFVLPDDAVPRLRYRGFVPDSARKVVLPSISHMYSWVSRGLGVAIGYDERFVPHHQRSGIQSLPVSHGKVAEGGVFIYRREDWETHLSPSAKALIGNIEAYLRD